MNHLDRLPQELVDHITRDLQYDANALKACALTTRAFMYSTRPRIFRRITIMPSGPTTCYALRDVLETNPALADRIHELKIVLVGSETSFELDWCGNYVEEREPPWIMSEQDGRVLARVLSFVHPSLKRISLVEESPPDWNSNGQFSMEWTELYWKLQVAFSVVFVTGSKMLVPAHGR
ncbi:hypothetical protein C8F01DRAFT_1254842 [Mycena amicta]|nr:hypothetical protein C8F01DRAFT_1254842 [Mycena amicta]